MHKLDCGQRAERTPRKAEIVSRKEELGLPGLMKTQGTEIVFLVKCGASPGVSGHDGRTHGKQDLMIWSGCTSAQVWKN